MAGIEEVHDLYRVDPSEFVEARAALVRQLRAEGRKDDARTVVKLRKPTAASWALDQVASDQPELVDAALAAGDALAEATAKMLDGDASDLRAATDQERTASAAVVDAAGTHLPSLTAELRERMAATLRAAIADDAVRADLVDGLLSIDHEAPVGFAAATATAAGPPAEPAPQLAPPPRRKTRRVGSPSGGARPAPPDEVDVRRKAKAAEARAAEHAALRKQREEERAKERERKRLQAQLDAAANEARAHAVALARAAADAEAAAALARDAATAAEAAAAAADAAAAAGPPG